MFSYQARFLRRATQAHGSCRQPQSAARNSMVAIDGCVRRFYTVTSPCARMPGFVHKLSSSLHTASTQPPPTMMQPTPSPPPGTVAPAAVAPQPPKPKAILVTNIAPAASERNITDFFSYCGKIDSLSFRRNAGTDGTSEAVVTFQTDAAVTTALMLSSAQIEGRGIVVTPFVPTNESPSTATLPTVVQTGDQIQNRTFQEADEQRTKTSVVASIIAGGYALGSDFSEKAKEYDEKHNISTQLRVGAEELKKKVNEIDTTYGISTTAQALANAAQEKIKSVDQQYAISQTIAEKSKALDESYGLSTKWANASAYFAATAQYAADVVNTTMQNPTVVSATATINSYAAPIGQSIAAVEQESKALIEEQKRQKAEQAHEPSAQVDGAIAPTATPAPIATPVAPTQPKQA